MKTLPKYDQDNDIGAVDRVRFAMINNRMDALTELEKEQFKRWCQIDDLIRSKRYINVKGQQEPAIGRRRIRNIVMVKYMVSWDTAERDIRNAIKLFTPAEDEKDYHRSVYIEDVEQKAEEAALNGKWGEYASLMKLLGEWREFGKTVIDIEHDKIEAFQFFIEYNPEAIGLKTIENKDEIFKRWQKKKRLSDKMLDEAEDADYDI